MEIYQRCSREGAERKQEENGVGQRLPGAAAQKGGHRANGIEGGGGVGGGADGGGGGVRRERAVTSGP